jgi:hypothetical protein
MAETLKMSPTTRRI